MAVLQHILSSLRFQQRCGLARCLVRQQHDTAARVSSLYVSNEIGQHTSPIELDLNLEEIVDDIPSMQENLSRRGIELDIEKFADSFKKMQNLTLKLREIENKRVENTLRMKELLRSGSNDGNEIREEGKQLKKAVKPLNKELMALKEDVMLTALTLPNRIDPEIPDNTTVTHKSNHELQSRMCHSETIPPQLLTFKPTSPGYAYLSGDLASLEHAIVSYFTEKLDESGYMCAIAPDIFKTLVVEGCDYDMKSLNKIQQKPGTISGASEKALEYSKLEHGQILAGISPMSMTAFFTRTVTDPDTLPLRFQCLGRNYNNVNTDEIANSLLHLKQNSGIHIYQVAGDSASCKELLHESRDVLWNIYREFDLPLKLSVLGAKCLDNRETCGYELESFMPGLNSYFSLSRLSCVDDYFSRRLMMRIGGKGSQFQFRYLHVVHGQAVCAQTLMAAIIENNVCGEGVRVPDILLDKWIGPQPKNGIIFRYAKIGTI